MNEMTDAYCEYFVINERTVMFRIKLADYPHLGNPVVIERCMNQYLDYYPRVTEWRAVAKSGNLDITVVGNLNER